MEMYLTMEQATGVQVREVSLHSNGTLRAATAVSLNGIEIKLINDESSSSGGCSALASLQHSLKLTLVSPVKL